ncbi:acyl-CoA dehydrogenase family protein [Mycobacterium sp. MAA66]|uniref:acyl-CoA dehydrogenase family protein n=1 Tax=Mycobacterium sp. MAA66 TaxID=3156297 RepID=UPI0035176DE2
MTGWNPPSFTAASTDRENELVRRAAELVPLLRDNADKAEQERRLTDEAVTRLEDEELLSLFVPQRFGGPQAGLATLTRVSAELGRGCGSTGWASMIMSTMGWIVAQFPEQAQDDVWGETNKARACGSIIGKQCTATRVDGGVIVSGSWPFTTGSLHAQWVIVGFGVLNADGEMEILDGLIPISEVQIADTWHVAGMKATGSNTTVVDSVFIPDYRISKAEDRRTDEVRMAPDSGVEAPYRSSFLPFLVTTGIGPCLGIATGAIQHALETLPKRSISYTNYARASDAPTVQAALAEATAKVDAAYLIGYRNAVQIDEWATARKPMPPMERARIRRDVGFACRLTREAVNVLLDASGAGSFASANPLQRMWRDLEVITRHGMLVPALNADIYGRAVFGATPISSIG